MPTTPRIAIDAMGGDGGPAVTVPAAAAIAGRTDVVLVGDRDAIHRALPAGAPDMAIVHAGGRLTPGTPLRDVLRRHPDSSMRQALLCHARQRADAVVSAGDTAALMALSRAVLKMVPGVERPAICKEIAGKAGPFWMLDLGANVECTPAQLIQFAHMGTTLARHVGRIEAPRVALLNIGTEAAKGPEVLRHTAELLSADPGLHYVGFIEGSVMFDGLADVVVTDGFAGNIALKSIEGAARMASHLLRSWFEGRSPAEQAGLAPARTRLEALRHELDPQRYNGASLVGLAGVVIKSHGSADMEGFRRAIEEALLEVSADVPLHLATELAGTGPSPRPVP